MESQDGVQEIVMGRASSPIVHQLKTGLVELLHLAEQLRRGGPPEAAAGCRVTRGRDKGPGRSGWRTHCQGAGQGAGQALVRPRLVREEEVWLQQVEGGWEAGREERAVHGSSVAANAGLVATTHSSLVTQAAQLQHPQLALMQEQTEEETGERQQDNSHEILGRGKELLVQIQNEGAVSVEGSRAFLKLVSLLKTVSHQTALLMVNAFKGIYTISIIFTYLHSKTFLLDIFLYGYS